MTKHGVIFYLDGFMLVGLTILKKRNRGKENIAYDWQETARTDEYYSEEVIFNAPRLIK